MVSESLYVGSGPDSDTEHRLYNRHVIRVATAQQAAKVINGGNVAIVPTTDVAKEALIVLGYGPVWAAMAVHETVSPDDPMVYL